MMSPDIIEELLVVGSAFAGGAFITVVYDGLRIFRRIIYHGNFWIGVEDLIFWIWTAFWIFSVLYRGNDGELRFYTLFSMALGMIVYHKTVSEPLVYFLGRIGRKILELLCYPLKKAWRGIIMKMSKWAQLFRRKKNVKDETQKKLK